jgi:hypothetical protein
MREGVTIRAKQSKVFFGIISPIAVDMVGHQRDLPGFGIYLSQSAQNALVSKLVSKIPLDAMRYYSNTL